MVITNDIVKFTDQQSLWQKEVELFVSKYGNTNRVNLSNLQSIGR